jgi:HAE1 family hydrophobic/amphiphilic exporter-1
VFLPISFLPGVVGQFFREFGLVLAAAIFFSWLEALFFLTVRLAYLPDPIPPSWSQVGKRARELGKDLAWAIRAELYRDPRYPLSAKLLNAILTPLRLALAPIRWLGALVGNVLGAITLSLHRSSERGFDRLRNGYARSLAWLLPRSPLVLAAGMLFFLSTALVAPRIPFNFTPKSDIGIVNIQLRLPKGTALSQTDRLTRRLEEYLLAQPYVEEVLSEVGATRGGIGNSSPERSSLTVSLVDRRERENIYVIVPKLEAALQGLLAEHPEAELKVRAAEGGPGGDDFQFTLSAPTQTLLEERNNQALQILKGIPALTNISSSLAEKTAERVLVPNPAALVGTGLTPSDLAQTLRIYNAGVEAGKLRAGGEETPIVVKADPTLIPDQSALLSLPVFSQALRQSLPLSLLSRFESRQSPATLARNNQAFSAGITANLAPGASGGVLQYSRQIRLELEHQGVLKDGVQLESTGGTAFAGDLFGALPIAFGLSVLLNYLVIASQFNTFRYPLYLLVPIPLALVGAFWALFLFRSGLDVVSVLGLVLLNGLVTKNAILLLDFAVRRAQEMPLFDALVEAARLRLRPILMTTLTVLIISIPLILSSGEGSEFRKPLGIIILGGVTTSTFLTLFVVPAAFYLFERRRYAKLRNEARLAPIPVGD